MVSKTNILKSLSRQKILSYILMGCVAILSYVLIILPWAFRSGNPSLLLGDVTTQDLRSPRAIEYLSEIRTEEARKEAEREVEPVYAQPDGNVARGQLELLNQSLGIISAIRSDPLASNEEKQNQIMSIEPIRLSQESSNTLLLVNDETWSQLRIEAVKVLDEIMRNPIRSDDLETNLENISSWVSLSLDQIEVRLVKELVTPLVVVNSFYSPELTEAARTLARNSVEPVMVSYRQGEMVISTGQVVTPELFEALEVLDLIQPVSQDKEILGGAALVLFSLLLSVLFLRRIKPGFLADLRSIVILVFLFLIFLAGARLSIPNRTIIPYIFPIPAFGLLISTLFGMRSGMFFSLVLSVISAYGLPNSLDLTPFYIFCSLSGILALGQGRRVGHFFWAAAVMAGTGCAILISFRFPFLTTDLLGMATLAGAAAFNGIASTSLALLMQFLLAQFLGSTTALQLLEISRPDFPLLKYFLLRAPGTYQHSLQVANLAEQAAEQIGADAMLTRTGALYHDVGKAENALFFIENQPNGNLNPHNDLPAEESAATIIAHVNDGLELARKYRLPQRLHDFIREHHGKLITKYQYNRALEEMGGKKELVNEEKFRYPGPSPRSRETALLMLADGVEATVRAKQPATDEELAAIIKKIVENIQREGQLDNTPLTQRDLNLVIQSFTNTILGVKHPRLEYPKDEYGNENDISASSNIVTKPRGIRGLGRDKP